MRRKLFAAMLFSSACMLSAVAQNEVRHYDGTTAFASRGVSATDEKGLIQRLPGDQIGGATQIHSHNFIIQDQDVCTPEPMTIVIYPNNPAGAATGEPDIANPLASGNVTLSDTANCPGGFAYNFTVTWSTPITLPFQDCNVPANDVYHGIRMPAQPLWSSDGLSIWASTTEDENASTVGYTGSAGVPGLAWEVNFTTGAPPQLGTSDRAWNAGLRLVEDVVQPFATNTGLEDPHFGYAGIFPDATRGDQANLILRSSSPIGTKSWFLISTSSIPAATSPFATGVLCLGSPFIVVGAFPTTAPSGGSVSESTLGPVTIPPHPPGIVVYVQGLTFPGPLFNFSTLASIHLP